MTLEEATASVIAALEAFGVPYMVVGSVAAGRYGLIRATADADFLVEVDERSINELVSRLALEIRRDPQITFESVTGK
jgi:hypothetical protein